eukprot:9731810-Heterocapsa_arctica.AAC.1
MYVEGGHGAGTLSDDGGEETKPAVTPDRTSAHVEIRRDEGHDVLRHLLTREDIQLGPRGPPRRTLINHI